MVKNRLFLRGLFVLYQGIWWCATLLIPLVLGYRLVRGKDTIHRLQERLSFTSAERPPGPLLWLHAASIGELRSGLLVLNQILNRKKQWHALVTTSTRTSYDRFKHVLPKRVTHQFVPLDHPLIVRRFRSHWRPSAVVWCEQELWPNMVTMIVARISGPRILVQARLSQSSYRKWARFPMIFQSIVSSFHKVFTQSRQEEERWQALGVTQSSYVGNLKRLSPPAPKSGSIKRPPVHVLLKHKRPSWLALSIHQEDIEGLLKCHEMLRDKWASMTSVWILRHPVILKRLKVLASRRGISVQLWDAQHQDEKANLLVWDRIGHLEQVLLQPIPLCVMGGSFHAHIGGHNPYEPLSYGKITLAGPCMNNFAEETETLIARDQLHCVPGYKELSSGIDTIWRSPTKFEEMQKKAKQPLPQDQALSKILASFLDLSRQEFKKKRV